MEPKFFQKDVETMKRADIEALQLERLRWMVDYCYNNVPFYHERLGQAGVTSGDKIKTLSDIQYIPFTTKDDIRDNYPFGMLAVPMKDIVRIHASSGTTGKPTVGAYTKEDIENWSDFVARIVTASGVTSDDIIQISFGYGLFTGALGLHFGLEKVGATVIPASSGNSEKQLMMLRDFGVTGLVATLGTREREERIQRGVHYSEMLPLEYEPSPAYLAAYHDALDRYAPLTADAVARPAGQVWAEKGDRCVLVSLARAGTPIGILIRRYLRGRYGADLPHYTISIIRGRGIDRNAMAYLLARHAPGDLQFGDGWTGKGAIQRQLDAAMADYPGVDPGLAVLSDPANVAAVCGTHDDFLIASSCLNSTVSGLLSRTFLRSDIIGPEDFHGAVFYRELMLSLIHI